jgi:uncharacterized small protein (DUF1192 family)
MEASTREKVVGRLLRMGVSDNARSPSGETLAVGELEAEITLLREENARLKIERHRPTDAGHVIERMRSIRPEPATARRDGEGAPAAQVIAECLAVRDGLLEACLEVQKAMQGIRGRLGALAGDMQQSRAGDRPLPTRLTASAVEAMDIELTVAADASPELAQSAA